MLCRACVLKALPRNQHSARPVSTLLQLACVCSGTCAPAGGGSSPVAAVAPTESLQQCIPSMLVAARLPGQFKSASGCSLRRWVLPGLSCGNRKLHAQSGVQPATAELCMRVARCRRAGAVQVLPGSKMWQRQAACPLRRAACHCRTLHAYCALPTCRGSPSKQLCQQWFRRQALRCGFH